MILEHVFSFWWVNKSCLSFVHSFRPSLCKDPSVLKRIFITLRALVNTKGRGKEFLSSPDEEKHSFRHLHFVSPPRLKKPSFLFPRTKQKVRISPKQHGYLGIFVKWIVWCFECETRPPRRSVDRVVKPSLS